MSNLLALPATELRQRIGTKEISPVELLEACIERIIALNPATNAITGANVAEARRVAKAAEQAVRRGEPLGADRLCEDLVHPDIEAMALRGRDRIGGQRDDGHALA